VFALEAWGGRKGSDPRAGPRKMERGCHIRGSGQDRNGTGVVLSNISTREGGSEEAFAGGGKAEWQ